MIVLAALLIFIAIVAVLEVRHERKLPKWEHAHEPVDLGEALRCMGRTPTEPEPVEFEHPTRRAA